RRLPSMCAFVLGQPAMATPPRRLGRPARFFFMHLGTLVSIIVYFVLLEGGLGRAAWTALAVHTAYMLLAHWQGERKQFDVGLWIYLTVAALAWTLGIAPIVSLYQRYSPALLFVMFGLIAVVPLMLGREPFTVWFGVRQTPRWQHSTPAFMSISRGLAGLWARSSSRPPRRASPPPPIPFSRPSTRTCSSCSAACRPIAGSRRSG